MKKSQVLSYPLSAQRRLWSDWADAQADLSHRWVHSHFVGFVMPQLIFCSNGLWRGQSNSMFWSASRWPLAWSHDWHQTSNSNSKLISSECTYVFDRHNSPECTQFHTDTWYHILLFLQEIRWATSWQNKQADAQADHSLRCPLEDSLSPKLPIKRTAKTVIRLGGCPGWSVFAWRTCHIVGVVMRRLWY